MTKIEFYARFDRAVIATRRLAESLVKRPLNTETRFNVHFLGATDENGGFIKLPGGRIVPDSEVRNVPALRARKLLWVNGHVPAWINLLLVNPSGNELHEFERVDVMCCATLLDPEKSSIPRDVGGESGFEPFRIRGQRGA